MPNLFSRLQSQNDEFYCKKIIKLNYSAFSPIIPKPIEMKTSASTLAFLLEHIAKAAGTYAAELRREEINNNLGLFHSALNFLQDFKPIAPAPDLGMARLYNEFRQMDNNSLVDLCSTMTDSHSASAERETGSSRGSLSDSGSEPSQKGAKTVQSKFKNCYGLVIGRIIKSIKEYLRLYKRRKLQGISENYQYCYIYNKIGNFSDLEIESFENYINKYHQRSAEEKRNRGKSTVYKYLEQGGVNGLILVKIIQEFLQSDNADFQSYINNETKPKKQVSHVLSDEKNLTQLRDAFKEMEFNLEKNGENVVKHEEL